MLLSSPTRFFGAAAGADHRANIPIIYRFIQRLVNLVSLAGRARLEVTFVCFVLTMPRERGRGRAGADPGAMNRNGSKIFHAFLVLSTSRGGACTQ